jgi:flavin reductase (DIM6/NTAB) family NADH-FMN oxidoreductase RutF
VLELRVRVQLVGTLDDVVALRRQARHRSPHEQELLLDADTADVLLRHGQRLTRRGRHVTVDTGVMATAFEDTVRLLDYPMFVVTAAGGAERSGCLVGFAGQVSIDPGRFLVCLSDKNHTYRVACSAGRLAVHLLGRDQLPLARLFGEQTGDEVDKFAQCSWQPGPDGVPVLDDVVAWFSGTILQRVPFGDHVGFLLSPDAGACRGSGALLTLSDVDELDPGHDA